MLRLIILAALLVLAIIEYKKPLNKTVFPIVFGVVTLFLALRGGQGTDYFSYNHIYNDFEASWTSGQYEYGYLVLNRIFSFFDLPFWLFILFYSFLLMGLSYIIISKTCKNKFMGLFVLYSMYFLQFFENGIRQALAMVIVLMGLWLATKKEKIWFLLGAVVIAYFIHTSAVIAVGMIIPYVFVKNEKLRHFLRKHRYVLLIVFAVLCIGLTVFNYLGFLEKLIEVLPASFRERFITYLSRNSSIMALLSRIAFLAGIVFLYIGSRDKHTNIEKTFFYTYLLGFLLYCALSRFDIISSRLNAYYKITEICLIPNCLKTFDFATYKKPNWLRIIRRPIKYAAALGMCTLLCFMYVKTCKDVMNQSNYYNESYVYPYYSIFEIKELYGKRGAPYYMNKEFYDSVERPNPRYIGYGDNLSNNYFSSPISSQEFEEFDCYNSESNYGTLDPLTENGYLPRILS